MSLTKKNPAHTVNHPDHPTRGLKQDRELPARPSFFDELFAPTGVRYVGGNLMTKDDAVKYGKK